MKVSKVVLPVAGWGTRSLPASKNIPKEMLPIYNKPVIQYVVEEAQRAHIKDVIFVTNRDKNVIEDHFDHNLQLEDLLERSGKLDKLEEVRRVAEMVNILSVRQKRQLGLGHAVLCARELVGDEPFAVMVGDDLMFSGVPGIGQLIEVAMAEKMPVIGVMEVPWEKVSRYGIIDGEEVAPGVYRVRDMVEKPKTEDAPSNLAVLGRYVLKPEIFDYLETQGAGAGGFGGGFGGVDLGDIFGDIFGGGFGGFAGGSTRANPNAPRKGQDIRVRITLTFDEAVHGCKKNITITRQQTCTECNGTGAAPGTSPEVCPDCNGRGYTIQQQRTPFGVMQSQQPCTRCGGKGKLIKTPCKVCHGSGRVATKKTLEVNIPMGIDDDQSFALRGMGDAGANGGPAGDVIVMVTVRPDELFQRDGYDVWVTIPITFSQAVLGDNITVPAAGQGHSVPERPRPGRHVRQVRRGNPQEAEQDPAGGPEEIRGHPEGGELRKAEGIFSQAEGYPQ